MSLSYWIAPDILSTSAIEPEELKVKLDDKAEKTRLEFIEAIVCAELKTDSYLIRTHSRKRELVMARDIIYYLARKYTRLTLAFIGSRYNKRDHTTVIHGINHVQDMLATEPETRKTLQRLETKLI